MSEEVWKGKFSLDDCEEKFVEPDLPPEMGVKREPNAGIIVTHKPTGMSVEAYGAPTRDENRKRAQRALKKRVEHRAGLV